MATEVWTAADLDAVRSDEDGDYVQMADIDLSGYANWIPLGDWKYRFYGTYNGNNFIIDNLTINRPTEDSVGLFGVIYTSGVTGINLVNADVKGRKFVGGIAGELQHPAKIEKSSVKGKIASALEFPGGIVGFNWGGTIEECFFVGDIDKSPNAKYAGGLTGFHDAGTILNCYAMGSVNGDQYVGGFTSGVVDYLGATGTVTNSYCAGTVAGVAPIGGFCGFKDGVTDFTSCYYDQTLSGQSDTGKGEPLITSEMKLQANYIGWDFDTIWIMSPDLNDGYPFLRWAIPVDVGFNIWANKDAIWNPEAGTHTYKDKAWRPVNGAWSMKGGVWQPN